MTFYSFRLKTSSETHKKLTLGGMNVKMKFPHTHILAYSTVIKTFRDSEK